MINEHDLADFECLPVQPLYKCERNSKFKLNSFIYTLDHIDGMYSVCYNENGMPVHISCVAPVFPIKEKQ